MGRSHLFINGLLRRLRVRGFPYAALLYIDIDTGRLSVYEEDFEAASSSWVLLPPEAVAHPAAAVCVCECIYGHMCVCT
jgi:hypothetical protein